MALARLTTQAIQPLSGSVREQGVLSATVEAGEFVTMDSNGKWAPTVATSVVLTLAVAVTAGVSGDTIDLVLRGPVKCLSGATPGTLIYASDTAGEPSATAGTKSTVAGYARSADTLWVSPQIVSFS